MNRAVTSPTLQPWMRRLAADLFLWLCIGVVMAFLGPFGTSEHSLQRRLIYWQCCMMGGGLIGMAIDEPLRRKVARFWPRVTAASVLMTPPVTLLVLMTNVILYDARLSFRQFGDLWFQVFIVCFATMTFRQFAWAGSIGAAPASSAPPEDPTATFRLRLSAKKRGAAILAIEAEDHYLRVHTDAGDELITARFRDALAELAEAPGFLIHRSWWVAADAIDDVRWLRGRGELRTRSGLVAPVSRSHAAKLKRAGWF
jgi:hypothetical protein